jgi:hypothetical protein
MFNLFYFIKSKAVNAAVFLLPTADKIYEKEKSTKKI